MIPAKAANTASRLIAGEAVILALDTKVLRGLNAVGSRMWELIDGQRTLDEIVDAIVAEFEVSRPTAVVDLDVFLRELIHKGLVTPA